jgi:MAF protein
MRGNKSTHPRHPWILASASPRRKEILRRLGIPFQVEPSWLPEPPRMPHEPPHRYAVRLARLKAKEVARNHPAAFVLAADTIVVLNNALLSKPGCRAEARSMLKRLSGRWHEVVSGICILESAANRTRCTFSSISERASIATKPALTAHRVMPRCLSIGSRGATSISWASQLQHLKNSAGRRESS